MKLGELAARLGCTLEGDAQIEVHGVAGIEEARAGEVTFLSNPRYARDLAATSASARWLKIKWPLIASPAWRRFPHCVPRTRILISPAPLKFFTPRKLTFRESIPRRWWRNPRRLEKALT